ncbi:hypothetical protein E4T02_14405 [Listeria monocytogenes]|uniref:hypothetical protein n=1 Tax=Listeria immobilis TaxID=2713502 RepID=UPI0010B99B44|nr:hypothetical protein [Listeria immobilis]EAE3734144.1 hypothetical protein [Listeria monocytogenes]EAE3749691.1 hypothetical protein [Listeria monocytogenes]EAE5773682.1 hypothetical protein [Listeria monocytogenes]EAE6178225.1 hypothetical protein [Listeria monocytogenes]EAE6181286.1 hypothetical protein [Listeria monocytogenes]
MESSRMPATPYSKHIVCINKKKQVHESRAQIYFLVELPMNCSAEKFALGFNAWIKKEPTSPVILKAKKTETVKSLFLEDMEEFRVIKKLKKENIYVLELTKPQQSRFIQMIQAIAN